MVAPYIRRQFSDTVSYTDQLSGGINNSVTSFTLKSGTTFPDGSVGPFVCTIDPGIFGLEEKVLVGSRSGAVCSSVTRGLGGTTPQVHSANAVVLHTIDKIDLDEANQVVNNTLGQITTSGDMLYANSPTTMTRLGIGAANNVITSSGSAPRWSSMLSAIETAFTSANQIVWGTGSGVGTLVALLTAIEQQFASAGQLIVGTGSTTGELLAAGSAGTSLTVGGSDPSGLQWQAILGEPLALTGAVAATRFVGGTTAGAPTTGTFAAGDFVIDQKGIIWVCNTAGSPGTWGAYRAPTLSVWQGAAFSYSSSPSYQHIGFDSVVTDNYTGYNATTGIYTAPIAGRYLVNACATFNLTVDGAFITPAFFVNGSGVRVGATATNAGTSGNYGAVLTAVLTLAASDQLELKVLGSGAPAGAPGRTTTYMDIQFQGSV